MNILKIVIAATLVAAAGSAVAEASYPPETPFVSSKTRAEVTGELTQQGDQGGADDEASAQAAQHPAESRKTRAVVKAGLIADASAPDREFDPVRTNAGH